MELIATAIVLYTVAWVLSIRLDKGEWPVVSDAS